MGYGIDYIPIEQVAQLIKRFAFNDNKIKNYYSRFCNAEYSSYLSYNFSKFKDIWYTYDYSGWLTNNMLEPLRSAIHSLEMEGVVDKWEDGQDQWSSTKNVFLIQLKRILEECLRNPDCFFVVEDQISDINVNDMTDILNVINYEDYPLYFDHYLKSELEVKDFESAVLVYCDIVECTETKDAYKFFYEFVMKMSDAPKKLEVKEIEGQ